MPCNVFDSMYTVHHPYLHIQVINQEGGLHGKISNQDLAIIIEQVIARSIRQGQVLIFSCKFHTFKVNTYMQVVRYMAFCFVFPDQ